MYIVYCVCQVCIVSHTCTCTEKFQKDNMNNENGIWKSISIHFIPLLHQDLHELFFQL